MCRSNQTFRAVPILRVTVLVAVVVIGAGREAEVVGKVLDELLEGVLGDGAFAIQLLLQIVSEMQ